MTEREPSDVTNLDRYGSAALPWSRPLNLLAAPLQPEMPGGDRPSAGPPPWYLYRFTIHAAFGVATAEPYGATRWRFDR